MPPTPARQKRVTPLWIRMIRLAVGASVVVVVLFALLLLLLILFREQAKKEVTSTIPPSFDRVDPARAQSEQNTTRDGGSAPTVDKGTDSAIKNEADAKHIYTVCRRAYAEGAQSTHGDPGVVSFFSQAAAVIAYQEFGNNEPSGIQRVLYEAMCDGYYEAPFRLNYYFR